MSRIAGTVVSKPGNPRQTSFCHEAFKVLRAEPRWTTTVTEFKNGAFGWCGIGTQNAARVGSCLAVVDGSIYNRSDFGMFRSDAELICHLFEKYGFEETLEKLIGDFAIALFDEDSNTLWLARDRFGIKPLYYLHNSDWFAFASRPSALFGLLNSRPRENRQFVALFAASHYRYFDYDPEVSPFEEIRQVPAAKALCFKQGALSVIPYWTLENLPDFTDSEDKLAEAYRDLLMDAISKRLKSAQKPAFTLSGGMDSSSVLACAVRTSRSKQSVFSSVYSDKTYDETEEIRSMLDSTAEHWHPVKVDDPDVFGLVGEMVCVHDEPIATATWLSHYLLCQELKRLGFKSVFGGLGGDELNAGEYEYYFFHFADLRREGKEGELKNEVELWIKYHDHPIYRKNFQVMESGLRDMVDPKVPGKCLAYVKRMRRYQHVLNPDYFDLGRFVPVMEGPFQSYLKNRTFQDLTRETAPCSLRAEDRQSMAFGLNHYLPFFDHRLVEFMFRVPGHLKIRNGITKHLLRSAMRGILPEETRTRVKKTGWNAPAHLWFARSSRDRLQDLIHSERFKSRGLYNVREVEKIVEEHIDIVDSGRLQENHMMFLWQLVNLELWFQNYFDFNQKKQFDEKRIYSGSEIR